MVGRRVLGSVLAMLLVGGCTSGSHAGSPNRPDSAVVIASFNFGESALLAEIYAQSLEHAGVPVRREYDLGPRELVNPALQRGLVDLVPEYLGTALTALDPSAPVERRSRSAILDTLRQVLRRWDLMALEPAAAQDQNGFAVTAATARRLGLHELTDLARVAPGLVLGGNSECPTRPLCLPGLRRVYGITFQGFRAFDDQQQRYTALQEGVIDVEATITTDPRLADGSVVLLADDQTLQPVESVVPVVSSAAVHRYGARLTRTLDAVSAALDSQALSFLNWRVAVADRSIQDEARGWLQRHGLLGR